MDDFTLPKISSFKELLNEIGYSWDYPHYNLEQDEDGNFYLNKLYISRDRVSYKTENWYLAPGVFEDVQRFYDFLKTTNE